MKALICYSTNKRHVLCAAVLLAFLTVSAATANELEPVADQPAAQDFALRDLHGRTQRLSDYAGKLVLVSFWATWCPDCIYEMPSYQALSKASPESEYALLAVNVGEDEKLVRSFAEQHDFTFPILLDEDLGVYKKWPVLGVPTSFVINGHGKIIYSVIGAIDWSDRATVSKIRTLSLLVPR